MTRLICHVADSEGICHIAAARAKRTKWADVPGSALHERIRCRLLTLTSFYSAQFEKTKKIQRKLFPV